MMLISAIKLGVPFLGTQTRKQLVTTYCTKWVFWLVEWLIDWLIDWLIGELMLNLHDCYLSTDKELHGGDDVMSGGRQILRYVTLLTVVSGVITSSTSEATYLQYLNGRPTPTTFEKKSESLKPVTHNTEIAAPISTRVCVCVHLENIFR